MIIEVNILVTDEESEERAKARQDPTIAAEARKWCPGAMDLETVIACHQPVEFNGEPCPGQTVIMTDSGTQFTIKMPVKLFVKVWKDWQDKRDFMQDLTFPQQ